MHSRTHWTLDTRKRSPKTQDQSITLPKLVKSPCTTQILLLMLNMQVLYAELWTQPTLLRLVPIRALTSIKLTVSKIIHQETLDNICLLNTPMFRYLQTTWQTFSWIKGIRISQVHTELRDIIFWMEVSEMLSIMILLWITLLITKDASLRRKVLNNSREPMPCMVTVLTPLKRWT